MLRGLICSVAVVLAVIVQLTIVNRIAFPGGTGPDLVLLAVAALSLATGPLAGSLIGFCAGLALDVAPPGSHFVGQDALVFCLIGYACGLVADAPGSDGVPDQGHTALFEITVTAVAAVFGEHGVSIRSMEQLGLGDEARLVFITHLARGGAVARTIEDLGRLDVVDRVGGVLRVVGPEDEG